MSSSTTSDILRALIDGEQSTSETLVPMNHLAQFELFMLRQGLIWKPKQDTPSRDRSAFLETLLKANQMDVYYQGITRLFNLTGGILWYLHPTQDGYQIMWFHSGEENGSIKGVPSEYKVFCDASGKMHEVVIRYSYEDYSTPLYTMVGKGRTRWVRLRIRAELVLEERFEQMPSLDPNDMSPLQTQAVGPITRKEYINTYGTIPCAESKNKPQKKGKPGTGDFHFLTSPIEADDALRSTMLSNVFMFDSPTLLTSRDRDAVIKEIEFNSHIPKRWAESMGFRSGTSPIHLENRLSQGNWQSRQEGKIARVIGNVEKEELFMYLTPNPISGDFFKFAEDYREGLHGALGGLDPYGPHSGATVLEIKSLSGKIAAVAKQKAEALFTHGLGSILQLAIETEEKLFVQTFTRAMIRANPKVDPLQITPEAITTLVFEHGMRPEGVQGLPPYGLTEVAWRWAGPVFEDTPRDKLDLSIVARNMQELGMNSLAALEAMFPNLDDNEKRKMLSGIPFRLSKELISLLQGMLGLYQGFLQTPDITVPVDPALGQPAPLAISMGPPIKELMNKVIQAMMQEYSYGHEYRVADLLFQAKNNVASLSTGSGSFAGGSGSPTSGASSSLAPTESESTTQLFDWGNSPVLPGASVRSSSSGLPGDINPDGSSAFASYPRTTNSTGGTVQPPILTTPT